MSELLELNKFRRSIREDEIGPSCGGGVVENWGNCVGKLLAPDAAFR